MDEEYGNLSIHPSAPTLESHLLIEWFYRRSRPPKAWREDCHGLRMDGWMDDLMQARIFLKQAMNKCLRSDSSDESDGRLTTKHYF
jgi:hypothetical protein